MKGFVFILIFALVFPAHPQVANPSTSATPDREPALNMSAPPSRSPLSRPREIVDFFFEAMASTRGFAYRCDARSVAPSSESSCRLATSGVRRLQADLSQITGATLLTGLARAKEEQVRCALSQVEKLTDTASPDLDTLANDTRTKIDQISRLVGERMDLGRTALELSYSRKPEDKERLKQIQARLREIAAHVLMIENSMAYGQTGPIRALIEKATRRYANPRAQHQDQEVASFRADYKNAVQALARELASDQSVLQEAVRSGGSTLDRSAREALIQDAALVERFRERNHHLGPGVERAMCDLNNVYGEGAMARDNFLLYGSIGTTALSFGVGAVAQGAARGTVALSGLNVSRSLSAARALGYTGAVFDLTTGIKGLTEACGHHDFANSATCDPSMIKELEQNNCKLSAVLDGGGITLAGASLAGAVASARVATRAQGTQLDLVSRDPTRNPQEHIWNLQRAQDVAGAREAERVVRRTLESGRIVSRRKVGTGVNEPSFVEFENGMQGVWKVGSPGNEVAAMTVDRMLGMNRVPETVYRTLDGVEGSVQVRVTPARAAGLSEETRPKDLALFDLLILNIDRYEAHGKNALRTRQGNLVAIDHDARTFLPRSFQPVPSADAPDYQFLRSERENFEKVVREAPPEMIEKLKNISEARWRRALSPHLSEFRLENFLRRREQILDYHRQLTVRNSR